MARGKTLSVVFKSNHQHQGMFLPPDLSDLIASNHPERVVNDVLDKVDITWLLQQYKPGGTSSYRPRMPLKVLVYGALVFACTVGCTITLKAAANKIFYTNAYGPCHLIFSGTTAIINVP